MAQSFNNWQSEPCIEWPGARTKDGYGRFRHGYIHRWVMAMVHGFAAIKGKDVMHRCDNPPCFRYSHLEIGTRKDNVADMWSKGRQVMHQSPRVGVEITHCPKGHLYTEDNIVRVGRRGGFRCRECKNAGMRKRHG